MSSISFWCRCGTNKVSGGAHKDLGESLYTGKLNRSCQTKLLNILKFSLSERKAAGGELKTLELYSCLDLGCQVQRSKEQRKQEVLLDQYHLHKSNSRSYYKCHQMSRRSEWSPSLAVFFWISILQFFLYLQTGCCLAYRSEDWQ